MSFNHRMRVCDPKWAVRNAALSLWSRRMPIFYAISAASLAGNVVVMAGSLEVWGALAGLSYKRLPQLLDLCELLVHRPVLYILLNLILLRIVLKSGVLNPANQLQLEDGDFSGINHASRMQWSTLTLHVGGGPNGEPNHAVERPASSHHNHSVAATGHEQMSTVFMKKRPSIVFTVDLPLEAIAVTSTLEHVNPDLPSDSKKAKSIKQGFASIKTPKAQTKRASLFTIEPLEMVTEPHATLMDAGQAMDLHATLMGAGEAMDVCIKAGSASVQNVGTQAAMATSYDNSAEERLISGNADGVRPDDYDLNRQEFNQRVDTFICKFKRNLTMERQDSVNRLLALVGGGEIRLRT